MNFLDYFSRFIVGLPLVGAVRIGEAKAHLANALTDSELSELIGEGPDIIQSIDFRHHGSAIPIDSSEEESLTSEKVKQLADDVYAEFGV